MQVFAMFETLFHLVSPAFSISSAVLVTMLSFAPFSFTSSSFLLISLLTVVLDLAGDGLFPLMLPVFCLESWDGVFVYDFANGDGSFLIDLDLETADSFGEVTFDVAFDSSY